MASSLCEGVFLSNSLLISGIFYLIQFIYQKQEAHTYICIYTFIYMHMGIKISFVGVFIVGSKSNFIVLYVWVCLFSSLTKIIGVLKIHYLMSKCICLRTYKSHFTFKLPQLKHLKETATSLSLYSNSKYKVALHCYILLSIFILLCMYTYVCLNAFAPACKLWKVIQQSRHSHIPFNGHEK